MPATFPDVPPELRKYHHLRPWLDAPMRRAHLMAFTLQTEMLADPRTPFGQMARQGMLLCDQTQSHLYDGDWGHQTQPYIPGTRPLLESYVNRVITDRMSTAEQVIALNQSMQDLLTRWYPAAPTFLYGESDEEVILKGGGHCSCRARLLCALCQVIGLEARPVFFWTWEHPDQPGVLRGGHTVAEVRIHGQWAFFDPMCHLYCQQSDGSFASICDIRQHPRLFTHMPPAVIAAQQPIHYRYCTDVPVAYAHYWERYFHPLCPIAISRHQTMAEQTIRWNWATDDFTARRQADGKILRQAIVQLATADSLPREIYHLDLQGFQAHIGMENPQVPPWT